MTKEEAIKVLSESIHDGSKVPWDKIVEAVHLSIEALSRPSLPYNLDEAAEEIASDIAPKYPDIGWDECFEKIKDGIKAGAEWMASQGVEANVLQAFTDGSAYIECHYDGRSGDKVIVQIRKK